MEYRVGSGALATAESITGSAVLVRTLIRTPPSDCHPEGGDVSAGAPKSPRPALTDGLAEAWKPQLWRSGRQPVARRLRWNLQSHEPARRRPPGPLGTKPCRVRNWPPVQRGRHAHQRRGAGLRWRTWYLIRSPESLSCTRRTSVLSPPHRVHRLAPRARFPAPNRLAPYPRQNRTKILARHDGIDLDQRCLLRSKACLTIW